jgi:predicted PurR-regulated permease PerM
MSPEERSAALAPYVQSALQWFAAKAGSVGSMLLQFVLTTIITAIVLARGETVRDGILRFARRLAGQQGYDAAIRAAQAIRGVVLGVVVTALVQSAIGGAGLAISGIPAAPLLAAVMLFLCLAQLGPLPVLAPAVIWLYWSGQSGLGTLLLILGVVAMALDNVVRPLLIRRGASLPLLLIFTGVIGGLIAMGIIGLFIGPVVLTVAYTLLVKWVADDDAAALGEVAANEAVARQAG